MDGGAWWAAVHGVAERQTRLSDFPFTFHFHAREKEMATHSSVLAWRIPGTGEPGGLPDVYGVAQSRTRLRRLSNSSSTIYKTDQHGLVVQRRELYSRSRACVLSCSVVFDSFVTHWSVTHQAPLSLGFPRQESWSRSPFPSPGHLPDPGIKPTSSTRQADSLPLSHLGSPD